MAYFAQIDADGTVLQVISISNADAPDPAPAHSEPLGQAFIAAPPPDGLGLLGEWRQTSYTSRAGNKIDPNTGEVVAPGQHFRFNYAGRGWHFNPDFGPDGAFIPPKPDEGEWILDPDAALWVEASAE
jgi:hypothetical protein